MRIALLILAAAGLSSYASRTEILSHAEQPRLGSLPEKLGAFKRVRAIEVSAEDLKPMVPSAWSYDEYVSPGGIQAYLLTSCWISRGSGVVALSHTPDLCYRVRGWEERGRETLSLPAGGSAVLLDLERGGSRTRVLFWGQWPHQLPRGAIRPTVGDRLRLFPSVRPCTLFVTIEIPGEGELPRQLLLGMADDVVRLMQQRLEATEH